MKRKPGLIFVTSEDDRYLVKGGIGTAVGVLTDTLKELYPHRPVDWITQAPGTESFKEQSGSVTRHYLSRDTEAAGVSLSEFSVKVNRHLRELVDLRLEENAGAGLIIEAADWEGLAAETFREFDDPNILKVSRLHTPLAVCAPLNELDPSVENHQQMRREKAQLLHSDLLSAPTQYVLDATLRTVLPGPGLTPPVTVIPNCANVAGFKPSDNGRKEATARLRDATGIRIPHDSFRVLVLGSVEIRKGVRIIQKVIPDLFEAIPDCHLVWIGHYAASGELTANSKMDRDTFYEAIPAPLHSRVHLAGFIDHAELPHVLPAGDLFALCYLADNFPGALLEVALAEKPMIALLRGGVGEMITDGGHALALALDDRYPQSIEEQFVTAAKRHSQDPGAGKALAEALRQHVLRNFSPDWVSSFMVDTYDRHLEEKQRATYQWSPAHRTV